MASWALSVSVTKEIPEIHVQIEKRHKGGANLLTDQLQCAQGRLRDSDRQVFDVKEHQEEAQL